MYLKYLILVACIVNLAVAAPRLGSPWDLSIDRTHLRHAHRGYPPSLDEDSLHTYDVLKVEPRLALDFSTRIVSGYTTAKLVAEEDLNRLDFRFTESLTIDSIWTDGLHTVTHTRDGIDSLQVLLTPPLLADDTVEVSIAYHGIPAPNDNWGGFHWFGPSGWRPRIAYSMGDGFQTPTPPANYNWIPTHDDPTDKFTWEAWFTVPQGQTVSSNGLRIDTVAHGDGTTTWHYRLDEPVSSYLVSIAASEYEILVQREADPLIEHFVYPSRVAVADTHFSHVPLFLDGFAELFGPYPFSRFGYAMTPDGDMEHATCVSHFDGVVGQNHAYDWLLAHELSHQWWGDWVTCGDWRDLWLNEGFGTYCEALSMEILGGHGAYIEYITSDIFPGGLTADDSYSIYDPDFYWGNTVYEKGACVMHMLRCLLGDDAFFQAWREYGQEHAYGTAVTADWQAKLEEHYGESLDWFFQPWVYGTRHPHYELTLVYSDVIELQVMQDQPWETLFRMPLDIRFFDSDGDSMDLTLWTEAERTQLITLDTLRSLDRVTRLMIDPNEKVLNTGQWDVIVGAAEPAAALPARFEITAVYPNPFNATTTLSFDLPQTAPVRLRIFDLLGREMANLNLGSRSAGSHQIRWDGTDAASGIYLFHIETPQASRIAKAVLLK